MYRLLLFLSFFYWLQTSSEAKAQENEPTDVFLGFYVNSISNIDVNAKTFVADFYLWQRFTTSSQERKDAIINKVEFMNVRDRNQLSQIINDEWDDKDQHYISWRIQGDFTFDPELKNYPFDQQTFPIAIENFQLDTDSIRFVSDAESYQRAKIPEDLWGAGSLLSLLDFHFERSHIDVDTHTYQTDFGNLKKPNSKSFFSRIGIALTFLRDYRGFVLKILVPLMIIVGMSYFVFFISPAEINTSSGISVTALLSVLALNIVIAQTLPNIGYMIKSDHFFIFSYALILLTLAINVYGFSLYDKDKKEEAKTVYFMGRIFFPILFVLVFGYLITAR